MTTPVTLCNLALAKLGNSAAITSIDPPDQSVEANYCAMFYPVALSVFLDKHQWSFATRRAYLASVTNTTQEWAYCYALPSNYMKFISLKAAGVTDVTEYAVEIATIDNVDAYVLYCNADNVELRYGVNAINITLLQPLPIEALAIILSSYLAGPLLKGDVGAAASQKQLQLAQPTLAMAIEADAQTYAKSLTTAGLIPAGIKARQ